MMVVLHYVKFVILALKINVESSTFIVLHLLLIYTALIVVVVVTL